MEKAYYLQVPILHHGEWYLKRGDKVPENVPAALVDAWIKARHIAPASPAPAPRKG